MGDFDFNNIDKSKWKKYRFDQIAKSIGERVEPQQTDLEVYVGLEHIDSDSVHIKRTGVPSDVEGTKLRVYPGDVIFGKRRAYQRKAAIATFDGICSAHAMVLRAIEAVIDPNLFPFFLHSDYFMYRAIDISVGSLSPTINWGTLKTQEFLIPPKDQQAKLAELLWAADEAVEKYSCVEKGLLNIKNALLDTLAPQRKIPIQLKSEYKQSQIGFIKKNWELVKQSDVATFHNGRAYKLEEWEASGTPVIRLQNLTGTGEKYYYSNLQLPEKQYCHNGDLLYMWSATFGAYIWKGEKAIFHYHIWKVECDESRLDKMYMYYNLEEVTRRMMQQTNGSTMLHITKKGMEDLHIPIPDLEEQIVFRKKMERLDSLIEETSGSRKTMSQIQKQLINQIFSA